MSYFDEQIKPKIQHEQKAEVKQEYKFLGSIRLKRGMKLYKLDLKTMEYSEVKIKEKVAINMEGKPVTTKEATYHNNCIYFQALNMKNAKKHAMKELEKLVRRNIELSFQQKQKKKQCTPKDKE